ncbi:MFS transporter, partial [Georgenia daeguensis]|uniref:MFS transporter n=1 Tax=Georgenia daeguensis TaxID=908355 RepID=UPI0031EEB847
TLAQIFSALGNGSTLALGSILAVDLSGNEAFAGTTTTALTLAPALLAVPLSALAVRHGRRTALTAGLAAATLGTALIVGATVWRLFPLLLLGAFLVGVASAVNLQARFAATDLARPEHRGRDLSLVVWAVTIGAVAGPNMVVPGAALSRLVGLPVEAGPFLISGAGMVLGAVLLQVGLRPDPLLLRQALDAAPSTAPSVPAAAGRAVTARPSVRDGWGAVRGSTRARAALTVLLAAHTA